MHARGLLMVILFAAILCLMAWALYKGNTPTAVLSGFLLRGWLEEWFR
jgi:hypothetical protein